MASCTNLTCLSLNVRGLQQKAKRGKIFYWLNKQRADVYLLQETHCGNDKDACNWTREWGGSAHWSTVSRNSIGVAILFKRDCQFKINEVNIHQNGRIIGVDLHIGEKKFYIVNVYAPNKESDREVFFREDLKTCLNVTDRELILGGDFNCTLKDIDRRNCSGRNEKGRKELFDLLHMYDLEDIYRKRFPVDCRYTYFKPNSTVASRIDLWLTSKSLDTFIDTVKNVVVPNTFSDHAGIYLKIVHTSVEKGNGRWQMNDSVVQTEMFKGLFTSFWKEWKSCKQSFGDLRFWWEEAKSRIADIAIYCSKRAKQLEDSRIHEIESLLSLLQNEQTVDVTRIETLHEELNRLYEHKSEGARIRAKVQWAQEGEMSSKYFHDLEKTHAVNKMWIGIKDQNGNTLTGIENILHRQVEFYENLYRSENIDEECVRDLLSNVDCKLDEHDKQMCDAELTLEECTNVVKTLKNGKSPGLDGITNAFYREYWYLIGADFMDVINEIIQREELCPSQYTGLIRLLYKSGDREDVGNWRPITLLNSDYKIIEKVLANRMQTVLPSIIKEEQKGFMKGRHIEEHTRLMEDVIEYCEMTHADGAILCIDQSKAFDRVEWKWLYEVMKTFGFGERIIKWVTLLYKNAASCIFTNGFTSKKFAITRGVRQGSPLGPYLYILQSEVLAENIRRNSDIKGITIIGEEGNCTEIKLGTFADDTQGYVSDENSINHWFDTLGKYSKASGAKVNEDKTQGILLGGLKRIRDTNNSVKWVDDVKVLGVHHGVNLDRKEYWEHKLKRIENIFKMWSRRNLTLYGKVYLIKCYGTGVLQNYVTSVAVPNDVIKKCETIFYRFLWGKGPEKVKREICIRKIEDGGLGMIDLKTLIRASRIKLLAKIVDGSKDQWKVLPRMYMTCLDKEYGELHYVLRAGVIINTMPDFYKECVEAVRVLREREALPECKIDILNQYMWGNPRVQIEGEVLFDQAWCKSGIRYVKDILTDKGELQREQVDRKIVHKADIILKLNKFMKAIPKMWKGLLKTPGVATMTDTDIQGELDMNFGTGRIDIKALSRKCLYQLLIPKPRLSQCEQYWQNKFGEVEWSCVYSLHKNPLLDRRIKEFRWKVLNKCLTTEHKIKNFSESDGICKLCGIEIEDVEHLILDCETLGEYWNCVLNWIQKLCDIDVQEKMFYLGLTSNNSDVTLAVHQVINFILEEAKWLIWKRRCKIRYDEFWCNDNQMVKMLESRISKKKLLLYHQYSPNESLRVLNTIIEEFIIE